METSRDVMKRLVIGTRKEEEKRRMHTLLNE